MGMNVDLRNFAGKDRKLRFSLNAFSDMEKELGRSVFAWFGELMQSVTVDADGNPDVDIANLKFGLNDIRILLWAGLKGTDPDVRTPEDAGNLLDAHLEADGDITELTEKLGQAIQESTLVKRLLKEKAADPTEAEPEKEPEAEASET